MSDIDKIVSNFISLALDVESENFTDGRLQRWNNMLKELEALIQEQIRLARIKDLELWIDAGRLELETFSDTPTVALEDFIDLMETNLEALNGG